ncbi:MAG: hypothetical protein Q8O33_12540, partial [Pseudomonadota bacterium]|nr:hypothetical protein [Pseudomonadota bacterium]
MKLHAHISHTLLVIALLCAASLPAQARDYSEIAAEISGIRKNIELAQKNITEAKNKASRDIDAIKNAPHFTGKHWGEMQESVQNWFTTMDEQAESIDRSARAILRLDPSAEVSLPSADPLIGIDLKSLRDHMRQVRGDLEGAIGRAEQTKQRQQAYKKQAIGEMKDGMIGYAKDLAVDELKDMIGIPTSVEEAVEGAALKGLTLVAKWAAKPVAIGYSAFKFTTKLYLVRDELMSADRKLNSADEVSAFADKFIANTRVNIDVAQSGIDIAEQLLSKENKARVKFNQTQSGWPKQAADAARVQARETLESLDQVQARPSTAGGGQCDQKPITGTTIDLDNAKAEAKAVLGELRSAAMAASLDGGSPLAYFEIKEIRLSALRVRRDAAQKDYAEASAALREAQRKADEALEAAREAVRKSYRECLKGCLQADGRLIDVWYHTTPCYRACMKTNAEAWKGLVLDPDQFSGPANAAVEACQEVAALNTVFGLVIQGSWALEKMMADAARAARNQYALLVKERGSELSLLNDDIRASLTQIPNAGQLRHFQGLADSWQARNEQGHWGGSLFGLKSQAIEDARRVRESGQLARQALSAYRHSLSQAQQQAQQAQNAVNQFIDTYGPLMSYPQSGAYAHQTGAYTQAVIDQYIAQLKANARGSFLVVEADNVAAVTNFPFEATANRIEAAVPGVDNLMAHLDLFYVRLAHATTALDRTSRTLTGKPVFSQRTPDLARQVADEYRAGKWTGFAGAVRKLATSESLRAFVGRHPGSTFALAPDHLPPGQLLGHTLIALHTLARQKMVDRLGSFSPVDEVTLNQLDALWRALKPLHDQYEALAAPERALLESAGASLPDEARLNQAYNAIPTNLRGQVDERYWRYKTESNWLRGYSSARWQATQPLSETQVASRKQLEDWIEGYPAALSAWQERERAAQQAKRQRIEAEENARREREERAKQAAQALMAAQREHEEREKQAAQAGTESVRKLYADFTAAYQARNLNSLLRHMTADWKAADGSDLRDLEDILDNSFRVFDRIQFGISGLSIQQMGQGLYRVSYTATITGHINQMNLKHQESAQIEDSVTLTPDGPKIQSTRGG